jgi:hypothetical protein
MHRVVQAGVPESLGRLAKFNLISFLEYSPSGEGDCSLQIEDDVIRALGEERVYFALNCMTVSCPRLPREAFSATALDAQLEAVTRPFIAEAPSGQVNHAERGVWLSDIFDIFLWTHQT